MEILIQAQEIKCATLAVRTEFLHSTLSDHLEFSELAIAVDWLQTQSKIFRDQMYTRKLQKFQQHLSSSMAVSAHHVTQGTTASKESVNAPHRGDNSTATEPQIPATESQRTDPNTATRIHLSKQTTSRHELLRAETNVATRAQSNKTPQTATPKRHRHTHRGRHGNTNRRASHQQTVVNLSDRVLTEHETKILSKGLKFVPTPTSVNRTELTADVKKWSRRMPLKEFYWDARNTQSGQANRYKKPSSWTPCNGRDQALDCYINAGERSILERTDTGGRKLRSNITKEERMAINKLKRDKNIVIFQADKGAAVVVQNRNDYFNEANKQLNGEDQNGDKVYLRVASDPTGEFVSKVKQAVQDALATNVIDSDTANYLVVEKARPGNIYFVPKIHKPQRPPPARPICNTINSATANISKWVDDQLQPLVQTLPSYLKDDNHFLRKINEINNSETLPADTLLVTLDVKSLYTNITHENGIRACEHYMRINSYDEYKRTTVLKFIKLVLTCNNLTFQGSHYIQQTGTAMGTRMAPTYANLYMGLLEEQLLEQTTLKPLVWFRFIDDIFLWTFGATKLQQFFDACNSLDPHIKFEQTVPSTTISFLDVQVILDNGKIKTDLYTKPTDTHQYLNWTSCHPPYQGCHPIQLGTEATPHLLGE